MNRKITLIATAVTVLTLTACDPMAEPPSDTAKECDVIQTAYEQQFAPIDYNSDGWVVMCVATELIVPAATTTVEVGTPPVAP